MHSFPVRCKREATQVTASIRLHPSVAEFEACSHSHCSHAFPFIASLQRRQKEERLEERSAAVLLKPDYEVVVTVPLLAFLLTEPMSSA